jgi:acid phosphatase
MVGLNTALVAAVSMGLTIGAGDLPNFKHLGNLGPYTQMSDLGVYPNVPETCEVDQVVLLCRHGERYSQEAEYQDMVKTVEKVREAGGLKGPLAFLSNYSMFMSEDDAEHETSTGPYNGHHDALELGKKYQTKYGHLWDKDDRKLNVFTTDQDRVHDTANHFTQGFFGTNWTNVADMILLAEEGDPVNTLTPENQCGPQFQVDGTHTEQALEFRSKFFPDIAKRVQEYTNAKLNESDIYNLMLFCPYEINSIGDSDFCRIFTEDEWKTFTYMTGLNMYYKWGYGQKGGVAAGSVYTNATMMLLKQGPEEVGPLYFNFAHDTDIAQTLAALRLFVPKDGIPSDRRDDNNVYQNSQVNPMLAHLAFERLSCGNDVFVRVNLNDAYVPLEGCQSGPGQSCPIEEYEDYVLDHYQSYEDVCGIKQGQSKYLKFFWDHKNA